MDFGSIIGNMLGDFDNMGECLGVSLGKFSGIRVMLARHDQNMHLGFRRDVLERVHRVVLVHLGARNFPRNDLAEQAIIGLAHTHALPNGSWIYNSYTRNPSY